MTNLKLPDYLTEMKEKAMKIDSLKSLEEYLFEFLPMTVRYPDNKNVRYKTIFLIADKLDQTLKQKFAETFLNIIELDLKDEMEMGDRFTHIQINQSFPELDQAIDLLKQNYNNFDLIMDNF